MKKAGQLLIKDSIAFDSGINGGWKDVEAIFNYTVDDDFEMQRYFGLLTANG